jgi:hypothetical protein
VLSPPGTPLESRNSGVPDDLLDGQHAMRATAIRTSGWEVSSWGNRYLMPTPAGTTPPGQGHTSAVLIEFALL